MHGVPAELFDTVVKAFVGSLTTWAVSTLFKKLNFNVRLFFARGLCMFKKNLPLSPFVASLRMFKKKSATFAFRLLWPDFVLTVS